MRRGADGTRQGPESGLRGCAVPFRRSGAQKPDAGNGEQGDGKSQKTELRKNVKTH